MALIWQGGQLTRGTGAASPGATAMWNYLKRVFPLLSPGGIGRAGDPDWSAQHSLHYEGRAIDMMVDKLPNAQRIATGNAVVNFLVHYADILGIQEITWNGWHWGYGNKWYWRRSTSDYDGRPDHWNHVHAGLNRASAARRSLPAEVLALDPGAVRNSFPGEGSTGAPAAGTPATGVPGGGAADPAAPAPAAPVDSRDIDTFIREEYGYLAGFYNDPEIGPILRQAASEGLSRDRLYGRLTGTEWWKSRSDAQRKWETLKSEDNATANRLRQARIAQIMNHVARIGLHLTPAELDQVAEFSLANDLSLAQVIDHLVQMFTPTDVQNYDAGVLGKALIDMRQLEDQYILDIPWQTLTGWAKEIASEEKDLDGIKAIMETMARQRHAANATLMQAMDAGGTPGEAVMAQKMRVAQLLEVDETAVDFRDEQFRPILEKRQGDGTIRPMTDGEATVYTKRSDAWLGTDNARKSATMAGRSLAKALGMAQ